MKVLIVSVWFASIIAFVASHGTDVFCTWEECDKECGGGLRTCQRSNGKTWKHNCHMQDCEPPETCGIADVIYVIDSSASIGDKNYWVQKQFAIDVLKGFDMIPAKEVGFKVSEVETRLGAVIYGHNAETIFTLEEGINVEFCEKELWNMTWFAGITNTNEGLIYAREMSKKYGRGDVKQIVILMTDGVSNVNADQTVPTAQAMQDEGIEIFVIGIGSSVNEEELWNIASVLKEDHYHRVPNYAALNSITNAIIGDTCQAANNTDCEDWSEWGPCEPTEDGEDRRRRKRSEDGECWGEQTRVRVCHHFLYKGDPNPVTREGVQTRRCQIECPDEPCQDDCVEDKCNLTPTTDNCQRFSRCVRMCECVIGDVEGEIEEP